MSSLLILLFFKSHGLDTDRRREWGCVAGDGGVPLPNQPKRRTPCRHASDNEKERFRGWASGRRVLEAPREAPIAHSVSGADHPQGEEPRAEFQVSLPVRTTCQRFNFGLMKISQRHTQHLYSHGDTRSKRRVMDRAAREARRAYRERFLVCHILRFSYNSPSRDVSGQNGSGNGDTPALRCPWRWVEWSDALRSQSSKQFHPRSSPVALPQPELVSRNRT